MRPERSDQIANIQQAALAIYVELCCNAVHDHIDRGRFLNQLPHEGSDLVQAVIDTLIQVKQDRFATHLASDLAIRGDDDGLA